MPDIQNSTFNGLPRPIVCNYSMHLRSIALANSLGVLYDAIAHRELGCVGAPEGPENGGCGWLVCRIGSELVGDFVDEGLEAEDVAEELALVSLVVGPAAGFVHLRLSISISNKEKSRKCVRARGRSSIRLS